MGFITDNERYNQVIDTWTHVNNDLANILDEGDDRGRPGLQRRIHDA